MAILRLVPVWAWAGLLAAILAGLGWLQLEWVTDQRDTALAELKSSRAEIAALESGLEWRRKNARQLMGALEQREQDLATAQTEIHGHLQALEQLGDDNAAFHDWAAEPVPTAADDWLRRLRGTNVAGAGDADGAASPDGATGGPGSEHDQPPRHAGADR